MTRSVIVPLDGTELAERALAVAASIAHRDNAILRPIHVHSTAGARTSALPAMDAADRYMRSVVDRMRHAGPVVYGDVMRGDVVGTLLHEAAARMTAWVVMAVRDPGSNGFGQVGTGLLAQPGPPILLCGPAMTSAVPRAFARLARASATHNVAIVVDSTADTEDEVSRAVRLARLLNARLTLIHVAPIEVEKADPARVDALAARLDAPDLPVSRRLIQSGDVASALVRAAVEEDADVIAMGRAFLGRHPGASTVLAAARQPLLI